MQTLKRQFSLGLALLFILAQVVTAAFVVHEAGHHCAEFDEHGHCVVCDLLSALGGNRQGDLNQTTTTAGIILLLSVAVLILVDQVDRRTFSPVAAKVRLNE